jgi:(R,R)-butanediol dehydrogenase/meso-butanediol dehydrogenase/diacetyl reductase
MGMKAARLHGATDVRVDEIDEEPVPPEMVRVEVAYTGICGSDLHEYRHGPMPVRGERWDHEFPEGMADAYLPKKLGHEIAGTITEVGDGVDVAVGDEVAVNPMIPCGACQYCEEGSYHLCNAYDETSMGVGGFAENVVVPADAVVPIPDGVSVRDAALTEPLAVSLHGVRQADVSPGDTVGVFGAGSIGLGAVAAAKSAGAARVLVSEPREARREAAATLGADELYDPAETDVRETVMEATDGGVDVAVEAAGVGGALRTAIRSTRYGGTIGLLGVYDEAVPIHPNDFNSTERELVGSLAYQSGPRTASGEFAAALEMLADGRLDPEPFVTGVVSLDDVVDEGFEALLDPDSHHVKVLVEP